MAIDKGLYQAPTGIEDLAGPEIEIEVEDPESVRIGLGDIERSEEHTSELQSH